MPLLILVDAALLAGLPGVVRALRINPDAVLRSE